MIEAWFFVALVSGSLKIVGPFSEQAVCDQVRVDTNRSLSVRIGERCWKGPIVPGWRLP